jgi:hypothetical protein
MIFIELRAFSRRREEFFDDESFRALQTVLLENPEAGAEIKGTGGLRKLRWAIEGHGKRGGMRVIYVPLRVRAVILLLLVYQKNEQEDLTAEQKKILRVLVEREIIGIQGEP